DGCSVRGNSRFPGLKIETGDTQFASAGHGVRELQTMPADWLPGGDAMEARVTRKLQLRILPFAMLLYMVSFLDRLNVGFAALTMNKALGLTPAMYGLGGGLFFVGYIAVQVPSNLLLLRVGARKWI